MDQLEKLKDALVAAFPCEWTAITNRNNVGASSSLSTDLSIEVYIKGTSDLDVRVRYHDKCYWQQNTSADIVEDCIRSMLDKAFKKALDRDDDLVLERFTKSMSKLDPWVQALALKSLDRQALACLKDYSVRCSDVAVHYRLKASEAQGKHDAIQNFLAGSQS